MQGLSFSGQKQSKRPGNWIVPVVLIVLSVLLMTISVRVGNAGVFGAMRYGVQTVAAPLEKLCSKISGPFKSVSSPAAESLSEDEAQKLREENQQLRMLVAQLEEYRQQDQRLTNLLKISDTYALQAVSGKILSTTSGWNHTAKVNVGSKSGVRVGMGVISSGGLYGQVVSVTASTCTVRMVTDPNSSVAAMIQSTRATGILNGSYDGNLILEYVPVETTVAEGDVVLSSGGGGTYPQGIVIGTVSTVEMDSSKLYYRIAVSPLYPLSACEEVLILTGEEDETASLLDEKFLKSVIKSTSASSKSDEPASDKDEGAAKKKESD